MSPAVTETYPVHSSLHLRNIPDYKCSCKILLYWCRTYSYCSCVYLRRTHQCLKKKGHQIAACFVHISTRANAVSSRVKLKLKHISLSKTHSQKKNVSVLFSLNFRFSFRVVPYYIRPWHRLRKV